MPLSAAFSQNAPCMTQLVHVYMHEHNVKLHTHSEHVDHLQTLVTQD